MQTQRNISAGCLLIFLIGSCYCTLSASALNLPTNIHLKREGGIAANDTPCDTCLSIVNDAEDYLASPTTQDVVVTFLQENLCIMLPKDSSRTCDQEARVLVAQAVASMEQSFTPDRVCSYMGACGAGAFAKMGLDAFSAGGFPVGCPVCKLVMSNVVQRLKDPESRAEIYESALEACEDVAEPEAIVKCQSDVEQLFTSLDALLDDMDAGRACKVLQFCGDDVMSPPAGVVALRQVAVQMNALRPVGDDDSCQACESIVNEAVAILMVSSFWYYYFWYYDETFLFYFHRQAEKYDDSFFFPLLWYLHSSKHLH